jgi:hypothetical protein
MHEVTAHYEAGSGIRPPRKSGRFRAVAREVVPGGGLELWHCEHDHAPGVRDVRQASEEQRVSAQACALAWLARQIEDGHLYAMPAWREGENEPEPLVIELEAADPALSEIIVKYRALITAERHYRQLNREVAVLFITLDERQKAAYIAATERIDNEDRA